MSVLNKNDNICFFYSFYSNACLVNVLIDICQYIKNHDEIRCILLSKIKALDNPYLDNCLHCSTIVESEKMPRSFASYLAGDVEVSSDEVDMAFISIYLIIAVLPLTIFIISSRLSLITKLKFFKSITKWCLALFTRGIIEQIFISTIKYMNNTKGQNFSIEIPEGQNLYRVNEKIFTRTISKRIKMSAALLFPFQAYILTLVIVAQLFMSNQSIETCEIHQEALESNSVFAKGCLVRPKFVPNISSIEFFNPLNAFRPISHTLNIKISDLCQNSSALQNETLLTDYHIQCTRYFFRWNNIIDTLTNALQWHQITIFIIKAILSFTFSWQSTLGHSQWWLKTSMIYRLLILVLLTSFWTAALIIYILIIIAFNKTLRLSQVILTFQTGAVLLIPLFVIPLLFYNTITLLHWGIRTIRGKKCEQEVSLTYDRYQNVLIYAENDKNQLINGL